MTSEFSLHDAGSESGTSDEEKEDEDDQDWKRRLAEIKAQRCPFKRLSRDDDPYHPGQKMEAGKMTICVMFRQFDQSKETLAKLSGLAKQLATSGKSLVETIETLQLELHNVQKLSHLYDHVEIVLHDMTRWRILYGPGEDGDRVQLIKLTDKGLPLAKKYRANGVVEPCSRYIAFFMFVIPEEKHRALEEWCEKLYTRGDRYDLTSTTINAVLRVADLKVEKALTSWLRTPACLCCGGDDDEEFGEEHAEPKRIFKQPVRLFQSFARKPQHNCVTLEIKSLKICDILTDEDVSERSSWTYTVPDLMRLLLSKTKVGSSPRKWKDSECFVISKETHVDWRGYKPGSAEYLKAVKEYEQALIAQHKVGLAGADEVLVEYLEKKRKMMSEKPPARMIGGVSADDEVNLSDSDGEDSSDDAPLLDSHQ